MNCSLCKELISENEITYYERHMSCCSGAEHRHISCHNSHEAALPLFSALEPCSLCGSLGIWMRLRVFTERILLITLLTLVMVLSVSHAFGVFSYRLIYEFIAVVMCILIMCFISLVICDDHPQLMTREKNR